MYTFSYLHGSAAMAAFWLLALCLRPDLFRAMFSVSLLFGIGGALSAMVYIQDWWSPKTLTNTAVGLEDFLFGFFYAGTVAVAHELLFRSAPRHRTAPMSRFRFRHLALLVPGLFFGTSTLLGMHSFTATVIAFAVGTIVILILRPDLVRHSVAGSMVSLMLGILFFTVPELLAPGWIEATWQVSRLSGQFLLGMPAEDFTWFLLGGAFIGPLYSFWKNLAVSSEETVALASERHHSHCDQQQ